MVNFKLLYGTDSIFIDITDKAISKSTNGIINIPAGDQARARIYGDPVKGIVKYIYMVDELGNKTAYDISKHLNITVNTGEVAVINDPKTKPTPTVNFKDEFVLKLENIHNKLKIKYGSFKDEYPEQLMATRFLTGPEKVLEIGGNIGRNSMVIASILNQAGNIDLVTLESSPNSANKLAENRDLNGLKFQIEPSALSKNKLIQQGWSTLESDVLKPGFKWVSTITLAELYAKYGIIFDTLILDCEGAFYFILRDMPEILDPVNLVIMENDYHDIKHKEFVDSVLISAGFQSVYQEAGGWGPCKSKFYEVFRKVA